MPTFTTIAFDSLIEPNTSKPMPAGKIVSVSVQGSRSNGTDKHLDLKNGTNSMDRKHHWTQISPALYATPEPTPLPDSASSFPPSPYIVNHKRRGPRLADEKSNEVMSSLEAEGVESCRAVNGTNHVHEAIEDTHAKSVVNGELGKNDASANLESVTVERDSGMDDFFDPQDSLSVRSNTDIESSYGLEHSLSLNTSVSEFYDAWEELSSGSGSQPPPNEVETELRELRLSLLLEIEKRKQAEEFINDMRNQWGRIREQLSLIGLNLPEDPTMLEDKSAEEELSRQVQIIRFVSNSIGRGVAKAELGSEMEAQLESKNFEISRLLDKLRYYEAVNHEMSQRNQETIEKMRCVRQRRKMRQRWIWGSIVAAVTVGSAALVWSKGLSFTGPPPSHTSEGSRSD